MYNNLIGYTSLFFMKLVSDFKLITVAQVELASILFFGHLKTISIPISDSKGKKYVRLFLTVRCTAGSI